MPAPAPPAIGSIVTIASRTSMPGGLKIYLPNMPKSTAAAFNHMPRCPLPPAPISPPHTLTHRTPTLHTCERRAGRCPPAEAAPTADETLPKEANSWAFPLARRYWQRVRRVSQQLHNSCLVRDQSVRRMQRLRGPCGPRLQLRKGGAGDAHNAREPVQLAV